MEENLLNHVSMIVGLVGAVGYMISYIYLQVKREFAKSIWYSIINFVSAILILISLSIEYNLAAIISNVFWGIISIYGVYRCLKYEPYNMFKRKVEPVRVVSESERNIVNEKYRDDKN